MSAPKLIDYSFARPAVPPDVVGVLRYGVGGSSSKHLTPDEIKKLHSEGKVIGLVFESTANRAAQGEVAGKADREAMEAWAKSIGYPIDCPIFYAVDFDTGPATVLPYFKGIMDGRTYPSGPYGGIRVVDGVNAAHPNAVCWQTLAWSYGKVSPHASVYQNGVSQHGYDTNVVLKPTALWGPKGAEIIGGKKFKAKRPKPRRATNFIPTTSAAVGLLTRRLDSRVKHNKHPLDAKAVAKLDRLLRAIAAAKAMKR